MTDTTKRYRLLKKYPSLPNDWEEGMELGQEDSGIFGYSPCEPKYQILRLLQNTVENNPEYFELVLPVSEPVNERIQVCITAIGDSDKELMVFGTRKFDLNKLTKIKDAIESALNDTVVEDKVKNFGIFSAPPLIKMYSESEVDAIRADEFAKGYYSAKEEAMDYLNLNSNDTGKEDNETKSANWRSENLSKQSAPEPSALPNKEYEIVDYGYIQNNDNKPDQQYIHSVRRFHDNTLFQVGSQHFINGYMNTIKSFEVDKKYNTGKLLVHFIGLNIPYDLSELPPTPTQPVVEDKPDDNSCVFTTEQYKEIWDMIFSQTGFPANYPQTKRNQ